MKKLFTVVILTSFLMALHDARATAYTYSGTSTGSGTDQWQAGTNWNNIPTGGSSNTLTFSGSYASGATINTNDNLTGTFQLKQITFSGTGPTSGDATVTISGSAGDVLAFQGATPQIGPSGLVNGGRIIYIFNIPVNTGTFGTSGTMTIGTSSSLGLTFNGSLSGSDTIAHTSNGGITINSTSNTWVGDFQALGGVTTINGSLSGATSVEVSPTNNPTTFTVNGSVNTGATITLLSGSAATTLSGTGTVGTVVLNGGSNGGSNVVTSAGTLTTGGITVNGTSNMIGGGTVTGAITQNASSGLTVSGNAGSDAMGTSATLAGTGSLGATALSGSDVLSSAGTLTTGSLAVSGAGNQISSGTVGATAGTTINGGGSLEVDGVLNSNVTNSGTIGGTGKINGTLTVSAGGSTYPGDPSIMHQSGNLSYNATSSAVFSIASTTTPSAASISGSNNVTAGTDYDQIAISGSSNPVLTIGTSGSTIVGGTSTSNVALTLNLGSGTSAIQSTVNTLKTNAAGGSNPSYIEGGANTGLDNYYVLSLGAGTSSGYFSSLTLTDANGDVLTGIIYYSGSNDRFNGIANLGDVVVTGSLDGVTVDQEFALSYVGELGTNSTIGGNDIVLTAIPEPSTWAMLFGGIGMLIFLQRARRRCKQIH